MHVSLTPRLEKLVREKVATGLYNNASEVIREALRLLEQQREMDILKFKSLQDEVKLGAYQADLGHFSDRNIDDIITAQKSKK